MTKAKKEVFNGLWHENCLGEINLLWCEGIKIWQGSQLRGIFRKGMSKFLASGGTPLIVPSQ